MFKRFLIFFFSLSLFSCSQSTVTFKQKLDDPQFDIFVDKESKELVKKLFESEMPYVDSINETSFQQEIKSLLKIISVIDYQSDNCPSLQVACSQASTPKTIFINPRFFKLSIIEQFTTLLHEAKHLQLNSFEHTLCLKQKTWGHECDSDLDSPYGIEYKYLLHKYVHTDSDQITQVLSRIINRINKI
jgi:hypothetical protein